MSALPANLVKQGFWIDWSKGQVLGSNITVTSLTGNVIIAVLTVVISLASTHLWCLLLFIAYQSRAGKDLEDGLFRQQQALLRTLGTPSRTLIDFTRLGWSWKGKARNNIYRSLLPVLVVLVFLLTSVGVSISSSLIVDTSTIDVLVNSDACGYFDLFGATNSAKAYTGDAGSVALQYSESCYLNQTTTGPCIDYVLPSIPFTTTPAPCPFSDSMCITSGQKDNPGITLDTGHMDSNDVFGINAQEKDRIQARKKTTCAPIKVDGYYTVVNFSDYTELFSRTPLPGEQLLLLDYGEIPGGHGKLSRYPRSTYLNNVTQAYNVAYWSGPSYVTRSLVPIPELTRADADTILNLIYSNVVQYFTPVNDPVFSAHQKGYALFSGPPVHNYTIYTPDQPMGVVGCAEQYQFCLPSADSPRCTDLGGLPKPSEIAKLGANQNQLATYDLVYYAMYFHDMGSVGSLADTPLQAATTLEEGLQSGLPDDQWKIEVNFWESFVLAYIQKYLTDHALGSQYKDSSGSEIKFTPPSTDAQKSLCKAQKMKLRGGFSNVSVFGLAMTVAVSGILILLDLLIFRLFVMLSKHRPSWTANRERWIQDGVLQLQRKAYEALGEGDWSGHDKEVPVLKTVELLSDCRSPTTSGLSRNGSFAPLSRRGTSTTMTTTTEQKSALDSSREKPSARFGSLDTPVSPQKAAETSGRAPTATNVSSSTSTLNEAT